MPLSSNAVDHDNSFLSFVSLHLLCIQEWEWEHHSGTVTCPGTVGLESASQDEVSSCIKESFLLYQKVTILPFLNYRWSRKWKGYSKFENRRTIRIPIHFSGRIIKKEDPQY